MPINVRPAPLDISPALRKRMQGNPCFNVTKPDDDLFAELATLTEAGFNFYTCKGFLSESPRRSSRVDAEKC